MTRAGFESYLYELYSNNSGAASSYVLAIRIIDRMFEFDDVFDLRGSSIVSIEDLALLSRIRDFIKVQQKLFKQNEDSIFRNIGSGQHSYPKNGFCSAAVSQLINYCRHDAELSKADSVVVGINTGTKVSGKLIEHFKIDKAGTDTIASARVRLGQSYFRRMVLANYDNKCCVTGLNVPQTLRASHIVAWAEDKRYRMDPSNGLCLSATYDAAFDKHLISFDEDYRMIVSKEIKEYYTNEVTREYFENFEGKQIILPVKFMPNQKLLARHRELLVV